MINIYSNEDFKSTGYSSVLCFKHKSDFWGIKLSHGATHSIGNQSHLYKADLSYVNKDIFQIFIYEDHQVYHQIEDLLKTSNIEPAQQAIKLSEAFIQFALQIVMGQANTGATLHLLFDTLYQSGFADGEYSIQTRFKNLLGI